MTIRVIDGGGEGFRRADVHGTQPGSFGTTKAPPKSVGEVVDFVCEDLPADTDGIAFALAGVIEDNDLVVNSPQIQFLNGVRLATEVEKEARARAVVFNDMEAAVTGMAALLADEPFFLGITWSSGIGLRVWSEGKILSVAEGGHMVLDPSPFAPVCGCGRKGHAEAIIGGHAIRRRVVAVTEARKISLQDEAQGMGLVNAHKDEDPPKLPDPCKVLVEAWKRGREWALELQQMIVRGMGIFLANIQSLLHVPTVVWKGTFGLNAWASLEPLVREEMKVHLIDPSWADEGELAFRISPGANPGSDVVQALKADLDPERDANMDALIGAAHCLQAFVESHPTSE